MTSCLGTWSGVGPDWVLYREECDMDCVGARDDGARVLGRDERVDMEWAGARDGGARVLGRDEWDEDSAGAKDGGA